MFWTLHTPRLLIYISTDLSPYIIVIDIVQTIGGLLRHPTHKITRIIIELSTAKSPQALSSTIKLLIPDQPHQATALIGGAADGASLVIDLGSFRSSEALENASIDIASTIQPPSGSSPVFSTADQISALHPSSSHAKRLMLRNSIRPYPHIQLLAQRWGGEPLGFAPPQQWEDFASTSGHHQSNEMRFTSGSSKQLVLRHKSLPFDAGFEPGIYAQNAAGNPSSVIGLIENTCLLEAPRAVNHGVIATSHWSTTTQSNGELQAFPYHMSSLSRSDQCGPSAITFNFPHTAPSASALYDLAMPLCDTVEHAEPQSFSHIQQSLLFQLDPELRLSPFGTPAVSFHKTSCLQSSTDSPYHPMFQVAHASAMCQCFNDPFKYGANGSTSSSDQI
jgi:hypothetical protein